MLASPCRLKLADCLRWESVVSFANFLGPGFAPENFAPENFVSENFDLGPGWSDFGVGLAERDSERLPFRGVKSVFFRGLSGPLTFYS